MLFTLITQTIHHHIRPGGFKTSGKFDLRNEYIIQTNGFGAVITYKVDVIIVVMAMGTGLFAKCVFD